jgi:hypothetical protein
MSRSLRDILCLAPSLPSTVRLIDSLSKQKNRFGVHMILATEARLVESKHHAIGVPDGIS